MLLMSQSFNNPCICSGGNDHWQDPHRLGNSTRMIQIFKKGRLFHILLFVVLLVMMLIIFSDKGDLFL